MTRPAARFFAIALLLGLVATIAETPAASDRNMYRAIGRRIIVLDCHDVHCYRILIAPILEHLPGPSIVKWKAYAVLTSAASAIALGRLCLVLGLSARSAGFATWIAAFGFGPLQAIFDPYTSDPLMYWLGPLMMARLLRGGLAAATMLGSIGVLAKEFAAVPLWMFALMSWLRGRREVAVRATLAALAATLVWLTLQTVLMTLYNYSYGGNPSVDLLGGGYFAVWVAALGRPRAAAYLFFAFGALFVLMAAGLRRAPDTLRLMAWAAVLPALAFAYVQQPDRALWNFHFVVIPIAMLVLEALPDRACWAFVVSFAIANVRLGHEQLPAVFWLRVLMLGVSVTIALMAVRAASRLPRLSPAPTEAAHQ